MGRYTASQKNRSDTRTLVISIGFHSRTVIPGYQRVFATKRLFRVYTSLYTYGTMGYGKSYTLSVLACLLYRQGERVVFIPDCRAMIVYPLTRMYMIRVKSAFLCSFADPLQKKRRDCSRSLISMDEVDDFCHGWDDGTILYFINLFCSSVNETFLK